MTIPFRLAPDCRTRGDHATSCPKIAWIACWLDWSGAAPDPRLENGPGQHQAGGRSSSTSRSSPRTNIEGRGPGTPGEEKTVAYLTGQFQKMGLKPGNPDGTYRPRRSAGRLSGQAGERVVSVGGAADRAVVSQRFRGGVAAHGRGGEGRGIGRRFRRLRRGAPEYGWDDYKGLDVRGKTCIMLVNDPPVADPNDPSKLDPAVFKGRAMTYYGRWTYKYEIASEKGAAAAILVHETGPAGYPFEVVKGSWSRENFDIAQPQAAARRPSRVAVEGWITSKRPRSCSRPCGTTSTRSRRPPRTARFPAGAARVHGAIRDHQRTARGQVAERGRQDRGIRPALKNESVIYTAHWDHLGRDPALQGDQIYNGAADNASGVAAVLEIARAFTQVTPAAKRSIVFLAVTAEEKGLLGAKYYAASALSAGAHAGRHQPRCDQPLGADQGHHQHRHGRSTLDDLLVEIAAGARPDGRPRRRPREGLLLPVRPFRVRQARRARARPQGGPAIHRQVRRLRHSESRTNTRRRTTTSSATR